MQLAENILAAGRGRQQGQEREGEQRVGCSHRLASEVVAGRSLMGRAVNPRVVSVVPARLTGDEADLLGHVGAGAEVVESEPARGVGGGSRRLAIAGIPVLDRQGNAGERLVRLIVDDVAGQNRRFLEEEQDEGPPAPW